MLSLHGGDHVVHGPPLERVHRRCPCVIQMPHLRIVSFKLQFAAVLQQEGYTPVVHARDLRGPAVEESEPPVVAGPADAVPRPKLDPLDLVDFGPAGPPPDLFRFPPHRIFQVP